jgi:hypothetical protein
MKKEYDFSKGERGKFFNKEAKFNFPIYLSEETLSFVEEIADKRKTDISTVVNELIKRDMKIIEYAER